MEKNIELILTKYPYNGKSKFLFDKIMLIGYTQSFMSKNTPYDISMTSSSGSGSKTPRGNNASISRNSYNPTGDTKVSLSPCKRLKPESSFLKSAFSTFRRDNDSKSGKEYQETIHLDEYPIVLGEISSDYSKQLINNDTIISLLFPALPKIVRTEEKTKKMNKRDNIIFSFTPINEGSKTSINGYGLIYYDSYQGYYYPKVVFFISEYPYFSSFRNIAMKIANCSNTIYPLEYILYNIVNYTPSPINFSVNLEFPNGNNDITSFRQLSCYPLFDFDLSNIFNILSCEMIVEIFFFTFLENDIIFFSNNLELLNIIMFIFGHLNFPCNDSTYFWQILSVSKEVFLTGLSPFVGKTCSCMTGINNSYHHSIPTQNKISEHFIVDLDNNKFEYKYNENKARMIDVNRNKRLHDYIKRAMKEKCYQDDFLAQAILSLYKSCQEISKTVTHTNTQDSGNEKMFFVEMNKTIIKRNEVIQNIFYSFVIRVFQLYTNNYSLLSASDNSNYDTDSESRHMFYISYDDSNVKFKEDEALFYDCFLQSSKFTQSIVSFIQYHECIDLFKIPMIFTEEMIHWMNRKNDILSFNCLKILEKLTMNNVVINVDFKNFCKDFKEKVMKIYLIHDKDDKLQGKAYSTKINMKILLPYHYYITNLNIKEKERYFPSIIYINNFEYQTTSFIEIQNTIEIRMLKLHEIKPRDLICKCIFLVFSMTREICLSNALNQISWFKESFSEEVINIRKYYAILLNICFRLAKKNKKFSMQNFFLILNSLRENTHIIPNEELMYLLNEAGFYNKTRSSIAFEYIETIEYKFNQVLNLSTINIKDTKSYFSLENVIKSIHIGANILSDTKNLKINIQDKNYKPFLSLRNNKLCKHLNQSVGIYPLKKLYLRTNEMMNGYYKIIDPDSYNTNDLIDIILNLLFYIKNETWRNNDQKQQLIQLMLNIILYVNFQDKIKTIEESDFSLEIKLMNYPINQSYY